MVILIMSKSLMIDEGEAPYAYDTSLLTLQVAGCMM
jgi:hypothetical protein